MRNIVLKYDSAKLQKILVITTIIHYTIMLGEFSVYESFQIKSPENNYFNISNNSINNFCKITFENKSRC